MTDIGYMNTNFISFSRCKSFYFPNSSSFISNKTITKNRRINNEFYLDIVLDECVIGGLKVQPFEVDEYNSWGTPLDLENYLKK